jgi:hypothetical protein
MTLLRIEPRFVQLTACKCITLTRQRSRLGREKALTARSGVYCHGDLHLLMAKQQSLNDYFIPESSLVLFYSTFQSTVGTTCIKCFNTKELSTAEYGPLGYNAVSGFLATNPEVSGSIPGATRFSEK